MPFNAPFPFILGFALALLIISLLYLAGKRIAPKSGGSDGARTDPYACGEDLPAEESRIDLERFLIFALFFLIFDVAAFVVATSYLSLGIMPVIYVSIIMVAVAALMLSRRGL